jgi:Fic family protein
MKNGLYTFILVPDWELIGKISGIDRFDASWSSLEKREGQSLKELKNIATVLSTGASTRIEGSRLNDDEVSALIHNLKTASMEDRDAQEVIGYYEALDIIASSYSTIDVSESSLKNLHNILLKHCKRDAWHRGNYKQHSNVVEAAYPDGSKYVVFQTTPPGYATEDAMRDLVAWYHSDTVTHPLVRTAAFVYDFLSIHPFQDGNGRLSRLLATLLLLKDGYTWIQYVSFEQEIELRKAEYYRVLMQCQRQRPGENIYSWVDFFVDGLKSIQHILLNKLNLKGAAAQLSPREKKIYVFVENHPGCQSGEIAGKLGIPLPTIKRLLAAMVKHNFLERHGVKKGTNYTVA